MKVGLIADTFSVEKGTGIARYNFELLKGLEDRGIEVIPISPAPVRIPMGDVLRHTVRLPFHLVKNFGRVDLLHATTPVNALYFPLVKKPKVVTYHDLTSIIYRQGSPFHVKITAPQFYKLGKAADRIIAVSSQTRQELVKYLHFPEEKIDVILEGVDDRFQPLEQDIRETFNIGYVGAMVARKRIDFLIKAFGVFRKNHPEIKAKLLIFGSPNYEYAKLVALASALGLQDTVDFRGSIPDNELVRAYNSLDVFTMPSDYEGFGFPILEAQRCGIPTIVRAAAAIPEEVTKCCMKAKSEDDLADQLYTLYSDRSLKSRLISEGIQYSGTFTWEKNIEETIQIYEAVLRKK